MTKEERAAYMRDWRKNNPEKAAAIAKKHYDTHIKQSREISRRYIANNRDAIRQRQKNEYKANPARVIARHTRWRKNNPAAYVVSYKKNSMKYRKENPDRIALDSKFRRTLLNQQLPLWYEEEQVKLLYLKCAELNERYGLTGPDKLTVDHVIPLKSKSVAGLHCWSNMQILCQSLNSSKGNRYQVDW